MKISRLTARARQDFRPWQATRTHDHDHRMSDPGAPRWLLGPPTEIEELNPATCRGLLSTGSLGRVVFTSAAMPGAQPVTYTVDRDRDEVVFRTTNGSKLAAATRHAILAFEVDQVDPATGIGWSVLALGQAREITDICRLQQLDLTSRAWDGLPGHTIAIPLQRLTGRRVQLYHQPD